MTDTIKMTAQNKKENINIPEAFTDRTNRARMSGRKP
jgi:hypothetical protein